MSRPRFAESLDGVLVVDKPAGPTSQHVVTRVRLTLGVARAGHAGTLDPAATGVLVIMVGAATKLGPFLSGHDKSYAATVLLGISTDTLDAEGAPTERASPLPAWIGDPATLGSRLAEALAAERQRTLQQPPAFSAIKVGGRAAYARARAGEKPELAPRPVAVRRLELCSFRREDDVALVELSLAVGKGYYVRALARDLGARLGLPAHLLALRRTASGPFDLSRAVPAEGARADLLGGLLGLADAARAALPCAALTPDGEQRAARGQRLGAEHFAAPPPLDAASAWLAPSGRLVAVGLCGADGRASVLRGFA
ncbi:MAG: tRNA pseudouridine(55) synthase TruB [Deltaproteobacteria bacterium]|nr:tRNA pseudouridine(55) synthase TruB [Deltaproteobacteria bacterium]